MFRFHLFFYLLVQNLVKVYSFRTFYLGVTGEMGSQFSWGSLAAPQYFLPFYSYNPYFAMKNQQQRTIRINLSEKVLHYIKALLFLALFCWGCNHKW